MFVLFRYLPSAILFWFLYFNSNIKLANKSIFISGFASKKITFVGHIFHENGKIKSWDDIKPECNLESKLKYRWFQLGFALLKLWKDCILNFIGNSLNFCIFDHHLIKNKTTYTAGTSWEVEKYIKYKNLRSTENELRSCTITDISTILISTWS